MKILLKNKKLVNHYSFRRLLGTELHFSLTPIKMLGLLPAILFAILMGFILILLNKLEKIPEHILFICLNISLLWFITFRNVLSASDRTHLDKDRILFLHYGRNAVILVKLVVEIILFVIVFLFIMGVSNIFSLRKTTDTHIHYAQLNYNALLALPGFLVIYLLVHMVTKWIVATVSATNTTLIYGISILTSTIIVLPLLVFNRIPAITSWRSYLSQDSWFAQHQAIVTWLPFFNLGLIVGGGIRFLVISPFTGLSNTWQLVDHGWYTLIPFVYSAIFLLGTWQFQVVARKRYIVAG